VIIGSVLLSFLVSTALAQEAALPFQDVPSDAWYAPALEKLLLKGWIQSGETFRGTDPANRAEFIKLLVDASGGFLLEHPEESSFDDIALDAWFRPYFEEAALEGWVRGEGNCFGRNPCNARPNDSITRAEAAALIVRTFGFETRGEAREFPDVNVNAWYAAEIEAAADNCVIAGDDATGNVRPADPVNRAEMAAMVVRADAAERECPEAAN